MVPFYFTPKCSKRIFSASSFHRPRCAFTDASSFAKSGSVFPSSSKSSIAVSGISNCMYVSFLPPGISGRWQVASATALIPPTCVIITAGLISSFAARSIASTRSSVFPPVVPRICVLVVNSAYPSYI